MKRLEEAGFRLAGSWSLEDSMPVCRIVHHAADSHVLYAFVSGREVLYIGKTVRPLSRRMYNYQRPGPTQRTSIANHGHLRRLLESGHRVDLYVLVDNLNLEHAGFRVSLAAGLEDTLIAAVRPPWNKMGR